jgi:predicted transposase/invertase (TIGR01784 family)
LSLLDFNIFHDTNDWHHEFSLRHYRLPELVLSDFHLSFIELKKLKKSSNFEPESLEEFWMLFLTEPEKLMNMPLFPLERYPNIEKAIELLDESKYTPEQLVSYDRYLDSVRTWNSTMIHHYDKGWLEGIEKGREEGIEKGIEEGINQGMETERNRILAIIKAIKKADKTLEQIALEFNESLDFIQKLID